jgi:hypothetical protein
MIVDDPTHPAHVAAHYCLGLLLDAKGDSLGAEAEFRAVIARDSAAPAALSVEPSPRIASRVLSVEPSPRIAGGALSVEPRSPIAGGADHAAYAELRAWWARDQLRAPRPDDFVGVSEAQDQLRASRPGTLGMAGPASDTSIGTAGPATEALGIAGPATDTSMTSNVTLKQAAIAIFARYDADLLESGYDCSNWPDARSRAAREVLVRKARRAALIAEDDTDDLASGYDFSH